MWCSILLQPTNNPAMEFVILIAFVVIIILLSGLRTRQREMEETAHKNFLSLKKELLKIQQAQTAITTKEVTPNPVEEKAVPVIPVVQIDIPEKKPAPQPEQPVKKEEPIAAAIKAPVVEKPVRPAVTPYIPTESWWEKWLRNNPDLEKFVGENLINKIGIAVLVLGIAFFVKYAIDQNWIKETGRVCIGIGCGIILIGIAHYLRNTYRSFSSVLAGGSIAVFYFTIAFAYHEYGIFSQTVAFAIMVVITIFAVVLALLYDKIELAVIAVIGGFLAPFLVSNSSGNYVALFTYLLVLNVGMLIIAYFKKWPLLHVLAFFFTLLIFGGWLTDIFMNSKPLPYKNALLFATAFYIIFLTTVLIHNLRTEKPFKAFDFSLLLFITFSFYTEGMYILSQWNDGFYQGIFTTALGILNLCLAWYLFKSQKGDKNLLYLLIGLTLTFISLAAPVQLHGHSITLFWSAECVLLYWLHQRSRIQVFKYSSVIVLTMMLVSLAMDWSIAFERSPSFLPIIFSNWQGAITNIVAVISFGLLAFFLRKEKLSTDYVLGISNNTTSNIMTAAATILLYITCVFAINIAFVKEESFTIPNTYHQLVTYIFVVLLLWALMRFSIVQKPMILIALIVAAFVFYLFSIELTGHLLQGVIQHKYAAVHGIAHWASAILLLYLLYCFIQIFRNPTSALRNGFAWLINILLLVFFSIECKHLYVAMLAKPISIDYYTTQYLKAGLTIVWALFSFVSMWLGMKYKYKPLRIISLSIFSLALLKLFLFDITNISEGGKIAAFIMLGILLLVISFMYQRLKKIIIDNEEKTV